MANVLSRVILGLLAICVCSPAYAAATVEERVTAIVAKQLSVRQDQVSPEKSFTKDLKADTFKILKMFSALQDEFKIAIPDSDAKKLQTVGQTIEYIQKKTKSRK